MFRKIAIAYVLGTALSLPATPGFAAARHRHWPIYDWRQHQPTPAKLHALHARTLPRQQAREVNRLYDTLESRSARILRNEPALVHRARARRASRGLPPSSFRLEAIMRASRARDDRLQQARCHGG